MTHSLTLGSLLLTGSLPDADHGYEFNVLAEGLGFGVAAGVQEVVTSLLADGDLVRIDRYGNREVTFAVEITGPSLSALAHGEAALRREVGRPNLLTWQPPDVLSAPTVFEVVTSEMQQTFDDLDELARRRTFKVTLTCAPKARSAEKTVIAAMTSGTTTVTVDDCSTATAWTGTRNGAPSPSDGPSTIWEAGSVGIMELSNTVGFPPEEWTLTRTGSVDFTTTPFLEVEMTTLSAKGGAPLNVSGHINGSAESLPILEVRRMSDGSGYFRVTFDTGGVVVSSMTFKHVSSTGYGHAWQGLQVRNVARTDVLPGVNAHQLTRILEVGGTERTPASIHIASADGSSDLGITVVHTSPEDGSGYAPPLRRWRVSGGTPTTGGPFSGTRELISPAFHAKVPTSALPEGGYQFIAILRCPTSSVVPIYWDLWTIPPGATTDAERQGNITGKTSASFTAGIWQMVVLAEDVTLPTLRTKAGQVEVFILADTGVEIDEAWLFRTDDDCALSYVNVTHPNLWLDSADQGSPVPTVWVGDGGDSRAHPGTLLSGMGAHVLHPDGTATFAASSGVSNPLVSAEFFKRWHSNAVE